MEITITEALAEIPLIAKRIAKKKEFIKGYLYRQSAIRDPHEKSGGSAALIQSEMQGIRDLQARLIRIRSAVQQANQTSQLTVEGQTMTIADWLTWRREIAPDHTAFLRDTFNQIVRLRQKASSEGVAIKPSTDDNSDLTRDYIVNIDEAVLSQSIENLEIVMGTLDGKLSLANATIKIEIPD